MAITSPSASAVKKLDKLPTLCHSATFEICLNMEVINNKTTEHIDFTRFATLFCIVGNTAIAGGYVK